MTNAAREKTTANARNREGWTAASAPHQYAPDTDRAAKDRGKHDRVDPVQGQAGYRSERDRHLRDERVHRRVLVNQVSVEVSSLAQHLCLSEEVSNIVIEGREPPHDDGADHDRQNRRDGDYVDRTRELSLAATQ